MKSVCSEVLNTLNDGTHEPLISNELKSGIELELVDRDPSLVLALRMSSRLPAARPMAFTQQPPAIPRPPFESRGMAAPSPSHERVQAGFLQLFTFTEAI
ncbi:hypothetical protein Aduo_015884 [Ancylostoma duodenale]